MVISKSPLTINLLCDEDESSLNEQNHQQYEENLELCPVSDSDCDYFEMLIKKETNVELIKIEKTWFKQARSEAIKWFLDSCTFFGFQISTAYLALIYFDRFFSRRRTEEDGDIWSVRIISVVCLSVAAKVEEVKVVKLSEYYVDEYNFEGHLIQKMELLVLFTLEWEMSCVTPFTFLDYFFTKFIGNVVREWPYTRAVDLIVAGMGEINAAEQRPSVVAAAAVLTVHDHLLTKERLEIKLMEVVPSWGSTETEHTFSCYEVMLGIELSKAKTPKPVVSQKSLPTPPRSVDVLGDSMVPRSTPAVGTKRKLEFGNSDQQSKMPKDS